MARKKRDAAAGDRGAQEKDLLAGEITSLHSQSATAQQGLDDPVHWICDGRRTIGVIYAAGKAFRAEMEDGRDLGVFWTIPAARCKILFQAGDRILEKSRRRRAA